MAESTAPYPRWKPLEQVLGGLLEAAQTICAQIESTQPDLVVALLHSGEAQLRAVMALWEETHTAPFPPVVRTNLGKEKLGRYMLLRERLGMGGFSEWLGGPAEAAHLLAWVADQRGWQEELAAQVNAVVGQGAEPGHILVVDDFYFVRPSKPSCAAGRARDSLQCRFRTHGGPSTSIPVGSHPPS